MESVKLPPPPSSSWEFTCDMIIQRTDLKFFLQEIHLLVWYPGPWKILVPNSKISHPNSTDEVEPSMLECLRGYKPSMLLLIDQSVLVLGAWVLP